MNKGKKNLIIIVVFVLFLLYINYKFNNILVKGYNYAKKLPKIVIVCVSIIAIIAPTLITKDSLSFFEFFLPDNMLNKIKTKQNKRVDLVVEAEKKKKLEKEHNGGKNGTKRKVSDKVKKFVAANQTWKCLKCKKILEATYEVDHVVPLYKGGSNSTDNLQALCRNCHGQKTLEDSISKF
jgi:5-methylcytosine-specific restriction enzyme A